MSLIDWIILVATLLAVLLYGLYKSKGEKNLKAYFKSNNSIGWFIILLSIMGTQASAITFLSAPGQAYTDGMRFVQYYFGLPLAMIVLCITFVPIYHRLKVFTAYEYLEQRFDIKTRTFAALLFLISRGLSTGVSIYAPSIILSSLLGWNIYYTNVFMGGLLIIYTVSGGAKAIAYTHVQQLFVVIVGLFLTGWMVVDLLPDTMGFSEAIKVAAQMGKMNVIESRLDIASADFWKDKYTIWSGLIGGFFLALSYFGTDQSQVGRYLTAKSIREVRISLLLNGLVKIPMQFAILLIGVLVFVFYQTVNSPLIFNNKLAEQTLISNQKETFIRQQKDYERLNITKQKLAHKLSSAIEHNDKAQINLFTRDLNSAEREGQIMRIKAKETIAKAQKNADTNDTNYIFLYFVIHHLPKGLIGLLLALIFLSAWGSIASALNALSSSSVIDIYKRFALKQHSELHYFKASQWMTLFWGVFSIAIAMYASKLGSLIEAVNIIGSLFYGTILGIFLVAFYIKKIKGNAVFYSAVISEILVLYIFYIDSVSFLWLNVIGCLLVMVLSFALSLSHGLYKGLKA